MTAFDAPEQRTWVTTTLLFAIFALLLVSVGLQAGVINPRTEGTARDVRALQCAQAESTANAFRFRQLGPGGKLESREHFLTRMLAQRHVLLLARDRGCESTPGFPPFEVQVANALRQINGILGYRRDSPDELGAVPFEVGPKAAPIAAGGDPSTGSTGSLQPGPREGGSSGDSGPEKQRGGGGGGSGGRGGSPPAPASDPPPVPSGSPPTSSPGRSGDAPGNPEPPASSSPGTVPSSVEAAGGAVKEAGEGAGKAVEGVGKTVDCALRGSC